MVPAEIEYEDADHGAYQPYKSADIESIDRMLAAGDEICLRNC